MKITIIKIGGRIHFFAAPLEVVEMALTMGNWRDLERSDIGYLVSLDVLKDDSAGVESDGLDVRLALAKCEIEVHPELRREWVGMSNKE